MASRILLFTFLLIQGICFGQSPAKAAHLAPLVQFSAHKLCGGDTALFINQTIDGVTYKWILSGLDTNTSVRTPLDSATTFNYSYFFNLPGVYVLTLEADNGHLSSITRTLVVGNGTKALFDFIFCDNQFVNLSTCADQYFWDFGDNTFSNLHLPVHQYADTGIYQVKLKVSKGSVSDSITLPLAIYQLGYQSPAFTSTVIGNTFYGALTDSIGPYFSATWNFGDASTGTGTAVTHVYANVDASYNLSVFTSNACGKNIKDTLIEIRSSLGIKDNDLEKIRVFPNPFQKTIHILNAHSCDYKIFDALGQEISTGVLKPGDHEIFVPDRDGPGLYILELRSHNATRWIKLLKVEIEG